MRLGVLDVGSNTVHLQVVDTSPGARPNPILPKMLNKLTKKSEIEADEDKLSPADGWVIHRSGKEIIQIDRLDAPKY